MRTDLKKNPNGLHVFIPILRQQFILRLTFLCIKSYSIMSELSCQKAHPVYNFLLVCWYCSDIHLDQQSVKLAAGQNFYSTFREVQGFFVFAQYLLERSF